MKNTWVVPFLKRLGAAVALAAALQACGSSPPPRDEPPAKKPFDTVFAVFTHPRCQNCHPAGDAPLQGDDSHVHGQNVRRGKDGRGVFAQKCASCHQEKNVPGENTPPGNPNWRLPSAETPLVFQGKTPRELAAQLKDPKQNGGKTLAQVLEHVSHDGLVIGCWTPGEGRKPPPVPHAELAAAFKAWVESGAPVPE